MKTLGREQSISLKSWMQGYSNANSALQHLTFREVARELRVANYCLIFAKVASVATHVAIPEGNT